jgi:uncharacterized membrane protein YkoI
LATSSVQRSDLGEPFRRAPRFSRRALLAIVALFALTFVVAQSCQESQVRIEQEQAIELALPRAGFTPDRTQIRLVRQGLNGRPFWAISFSTETRITTVRIDANTGAIAAVNRER